MLTALGVLACMLLVAAAVVSYAATRPNTFRLERSIIINAAPETIFALIADFRTWTGWSPWEKLDPGMTRSYSGAASGKGAVYGWDSAGKAGKGRMEISRANVADLIMIKLDFLKPFEAHNIAEFTLQRQNGATQGGATQVTWAMYGPQPLVAKVMALAFSMDRLVGRDFETGLANLKALAES